MEILEFFCKLDHFRVRGNYCTIFKQYIACNKRVRKFTPKKFYLIVPTGQSHENVLA